jgi:predicted GNAT family N-acyltransferase
VRHPIEIFDTTQLRVMAEALNAAVATVRLAAAEPSQPAHLAMGRRVIGAGVRGAATRLELTEAALNGAWG